MSEYPCAFALSTQTVGPFASQKLLTVLDSEVTAVVAGGVVFVAGVTPSVGFAVVGVVAVEGAVGAGAVVASFLISQPVSVHSNTPLRSSSSSVSPRWLLSQVKSFPLAHIEFVYPSRGKVGKDWGEYPERNICPLGIPAHESLFFLMVK